ncbi:MAG: DUF447 family protein [Methanomicrobiales archaeon]|nr:DUF447 family protein [Methanomicrobiales archaeon]
MGLLIPGINEVIATTAFNAAPIGIHFREGIFRVILFSGSHTVANVERDGWMVANIIHDPVLYVKTAFGDLPRDRFSDERVDGRTMQRLSDADAWVAFSAVVEKKTSVSLVARLTPLKEQVVTSRILPVNRGFNSIIDATVHATRLNIRKDQELEKLIEYHAGIVRKCGGPRELEALDLLLEHCRPQAGK